MSFIKEFNRIMKLKPKCEKQDIKNQAFDEEERQALIFQMKYIQNKSIGYIADTLSICERQVKRDLKDIREKVKKML